MRVVLSSTLPKSVQIGAQSYSTRNQQIPLVNISYIITTENNLQVLQHAYYAIHFVNRKRGVCGCVGVICLGSPAFYCPLRT